MADKVVFLAFRSKEAASETQEVIACKECRNKAWTAVATSEDDYPRLVCTACGASAGRFGWVD